MIKGKGTKPTEEGKLGKYPNRDIVIILQLLAVVPSFGKRMRVHVPHETRSKRSCILLGVEDAGAVKLYSGQTFVNKALDQQTLFSSCARKE